MTEDGHHDGQEQRVGQAGEDEEDDRAELGVEVGYDRD
jgi:hypothetical protein